jgi:hypothetical protein
MIGTARGVACLRDDGSIDLVKKVSLDRLVSSPDGWVGWSHERGVDVWDGEGPPVSVPCSVTHPVAPPHQLTMVPLAHRRVGVLFGDKEADRVRSGQEEVTSRDRGSKSDFVQRDSRDAQPLHRGPRQREIRVALVARL